VRSGERGTSTSGDRGLGSRVLSLSVVVAVRNAAATLREVLVAIRASDLRADCYEIIVVDDASSDGSVAIAARYADTVVKLTGRPSGPAYARNRGAELARGEVVAFLHDDAVVRPDTLSRMLATLADDPEVDAVSASRDVHSGPQNFISQYWNVLLRFGEQRYSGDSAQFAPGCGAVRRGAFVSAGMFDEWRFYSGGLESLELGERLLAKGHLAVLSAELEVAHLKEWSIGSVCKEVWGRSKLLARSLGYSRMSALAPSEVVFTLSRALIPAAALVGTLVLAGAFVPPPHVRMEVALAFAMLVVTNLSVHRFYARVLGVGFAAISVPVHILVQTVTAVALCTGWILRYLIGDLSPDATTQAYSEIGLEVWPPIPRRPH
jgi:GT2 family glycosyltransferase